MKIMSYNIQSGKNLAGERDIPSIAEVIRVAAPDICALNEVRMRTSDINGIEIARDIAEVVGMEWRFGRAIDILGGEYGNAILSRYPILESRAFPVPDVPEPLREPRFETRALLRCVVDSPCGPLCVMTCHFGLSRGEQLLARDTVLANLPKDMPCVFMGDLNLDPDSDIIADLRAALTDTAGCMPLTWPSDVPERKIDYIFVSEGISHSGLFVIPTTASDHLPVFTEITL